ncbi:DHA2 family efflux MFS transporter permease subunit [Hypericibacter sp.]|uniref:DHA2 family efflux MFS transporter permease subunit n=1 Tax=Hypericibacter sp. TaxID=2705401 RepID=UPI003D6D183D
MIRVRPSSPMTTPLIVACALFMENLDSTVVSTALPTIAKAFNENPIHLNLAITSYLLSLAVFIPVSGWVADRYGARHVFRIAIVVFTLASILCGLSNSLAEFVAARILQGMGGAMMVPVGRLVVLRAVSKTQLVSAMAYLTVPALIGPVIGPPVGGFIVTYFSWRWIFWLNLPIGILGIVLATLFIADAREPKTPPLDLLGFILSGVGLSGLVFAFETMGRGILPGWMVTVMLIAGLTAMTLYVRHARRVAHPVIDLSLLRVPTFRTNILGGTLFRIGIGALPFLMPLMLQLAFGLTPLNSGLLTFAAAAGALFMKLTAAPILRRFGFKRTMIANALISAAFLASYSFFEPSTPGWVILALLLSGGFFRSLQFTALNTIAYADMPPEKMSLATSFASMAQQLSVSIGVGVGALALHVSIYFHGGHLTAESFASAFYVIALCAAASALTFIGLPANAGDEVSGHARRPMPQPVLAPKDS